LAVRGTQHMDYSLYLLGLSRAQIHDFGLK
jgi:hypothetical protein